MSKEKQIEVERNEMSEIIAQSFHPCDKEYDPSDFEWSAHSLQMAGYRKKREGGKYIRLEDLQQFPIRKDNYDKKHGSEHFVFGVESVLEYAENLPTYDVEPKSEVEIRGASFYFELEKAEERGKQLMREHDAEVAREIFEEIYEDCFDQYGYIDYDALAELKKKYTEGKT